MKKNFLSYLIDPVSGENFRLVNFKETKTRIIDGLIISEDNWYPIIKGVPRILVSELKTTLLQRHLSFFKKYSKKLPVQIRKEWQQKIDEIDNLNEFMRHQKKTAESFAFEWKNIYQESNFEKNNFLHFLSPFVPQNDLKGKKIVDIGCGSGRFTKWAALLGGEVVFWD